MLARRPRILATGTAIVAALMLTTPVLAQRGGQEQSDGGDSAPDLASTARSLAWRSIGSAVISGRISDLAIHP